MTARFAAVRGGVPPVFGLAVRNLSDIADAFGEGLAARVLVGLAERIERLSGLSADSVTIGPDGVYFSVVPEGVVALLPTAVAPVCIDGANVVMALAVSSLNGSPAAACGSLPSRKIADDMMLVSEVYDGVRAGRSSLLLQPISRPPLLGSGSEILYWECFPRLAGKLGGALSPATFVPALERLELTRFFDLHVVHSTIDLLKCGRAISLGCNISAQSAVDDEWWGGVMDALAEDPGVAARLVIEVTESSPVWSAPECVRFIERMRSLGCRIALDDFGKGFHSIDLARECRPDIIKIDAGFLSRGDRKQREVQLLTHLISLANALADVVVIEGIEGEADLAIAAECGAFWMQGYHIAEPSTSIGVLPGRGREGMRQ